MVATQHFADKEIIEAIAVNVRNIDSHGGEGDVPNGQAIDGSKPSMAFINPDAIRSHKVVTDVQVRFSIIVKIMEHDAQAPIAGWLSERFAFFIDKRAFGPG